MTGAPSWLPKTNRTAPSAGPIVRVDDWLMKFWLPPSRPLVYAGRTSGALVFVPTEPAIVRLLDVNGTRTEAPTPIAALKRLKINPAVSTTTTLVQPKPHLPPRQGR